LANSYLAWARPRFARLQDGYLNGTYTRADLANLRNSFKKPCGSDPKASKWSLNGMKYRGYAKPTRMEQASWYAFGLYAYHQQGNQYKPMYKEGERFNKALRILADRTGDGKVDQRSDTRRGNMDELYRKLLNTHNMQEAAPFCLRIIRLLNEHDIPLDHALLALDLARLNKPDSADMVRRDWSRLLD